MRLGVEGCIVKQYGLPVFKDLLVEKEEIETHSVNSSILSLPSEGTKEDLLFNMSARKVRLEHDVELNKILSKKNCLTSIEDEASPNRDYE